MTQLGSRNNFRANKALCCLLDLLLFQNSSLFDFTGKSEAPPRRPTSPQSTLRLLSLPSIFTSLQPSQRAKLKFPSLERHWQPPAVGFCFQFQAVRLLFASKFAAKSPLTPGTEKATNQLSFSGLGPRQHQSKDFAFGGGHGLRMGAAVTCQSLAVSWRKNRFAASSSTKWTCQDSKTKRNCGLLPVISKD